MTNNIYNSNQVTALSMRPLESQIGQDLLEGDLREIHGGLRPPIPYPPFPLIPEPPYIPIICPPALESD